MHMMTLYNSSFGNVETAPILNPAAIVERFRSQGLGNAQSADSLRALAMTSSNTPELTKKSSMLYVQQHLLQYAEADDSVQASSEGPGGAMAAAAKESNKQVTRRCCPACGLKRHKLDSCSNKPKIKALLAKYPQKGRQPKDTDQDAAILDALHKMLASSKILESADDEVEEDDEASKPGKGKGKGKAAGKGAPQEAAAAVAVDAEVALDKAFKTIAAGNCLYALAAAPKEEKRAALEVDDMSDIWK